MTLAGVGCGKDTAKNANNPMPVRRIAIAMTGECICSLVAPFLMPAMAENGSPHM